MSQKHHQTWEAESCAILIIANVRLNDSLCLPGVWRLANSCSLLSSSSLSTRQYYLHYLHLATLSTLYLLIICMGCNMDLTLGIGHHVIWFYKPHIITSFVRFQFFFSADFGNVCPVLHINFPWLPYPIHVIRSLVNQGRGGAQARWRAVYCKSLTNCWEYYGGVKHITWYITSSNGKVDVMAAKLRRAPSSL